VEGENLPPPLSETSPSPTMRTERFSSLLLPQEREDLETLIALTRCARRRNSQVAIVLAVVLISLASCFVPRVSKSQQLGSDLPASVFNEDILRRFVPERIGDSSPSWHRNIRTRAPLQGGGLAGRSTSFSESLRRDSSGDRSGRILSYRGGASNGEIGANASNARGVSGRGKGGAGPCSLPGGWSAQTSSRWEQELASSTHEPHFRPDRTRGGSGGEHEPWREAASAPPQFPEVSTMREEEGGDAGRKPQLRSLEAILSRPDTDKLYDSEELENVFGFDRRFDEVYEVDKKIGEGAYGVVVKAHRISNVKRARPVAVKIINKLIQKKNKKAPTVRFIRRVSEEIRAFSVMGGDICSVELKGFFEDDRYVFMIMELCRGGELAQKLREGPMDEDTAGIIVVQILWQMSRWHKLGFVHTDVNPVNFLFVNGPQYQDDGNKRQDLWIKALDFGLSQRLPVPNVANTSRTPEDLKRDTLNDPIPVLGLSYGDMRISNSTVYSPERRRLMLTKRRGTPVYTSPDVVEKCYDEKADIWSIGALVCHMLLNRMPFAKTMKELRGLDKTELYDTIAKKGNSCLHGPDFERLSEPGQDFLRALLMRDPEQRPSAQQALKHPWVQRPAVRDYIENHPVLSAIARSEEMSPNSKEVGPSTNPTSGDAASVNEGAGSSDVVL